LTTFFVGFTFFGDFAFFGDLVAVFFGLVEAVDKYK
jgi:hypothetical protein